MRVLLLGCWLLFITTACHSNIDLETLAGSWHSGEVSLRFKEDQSFQMDWCTMSVKGNYRPWGSSLELISSEGSVVLTMYVRSLQNDQLEINLPHLGTDRILTLQRAAVVGK